MILVINEEIYSLSYPEKNDAAGSSVYIFDPETFMVLPRDKDEAAYMDDPILFPSVTSAEVRKAYIDSLNDKKLRFIFDGLDDKEFDEKFWQYVDDGAESLCAFEKFELRYRLDRITAWCDENGIPYYIDTRDKFINHILDTEG